MGRLLPLAALALLQGCLAVYYPTSSFRAPPRPADCKFEIYAMAPSEPFEELGLVVFRTVREKSDVLALFSDKDPLVDASYRTYLREVTRKVRPSVCARGGNGFIFEMPKGGKYQRGTVILVGDKAPVPAATPKP